MQTSTELSQERVQADWSDLPSDVLYVISKKLHDLFDFTYFRAVCNNWRTATSVSDLPHQIPWLLQDRKNLDDEVLRFYSLVSGKTRSICCPQSRGMGLWGPSHGYLYATNYGSHHRRYVLLNPITRHEVHIYLGRYSQPVLVCMDPDPIGSSDHMVFMVEFGSQTAGVYQPRYREWHYVGVPNFMSNLGGACLKGRYYMNEWTTGNTVVVEIPYGTSFLVPAPPDENLKNCSVYVHFVESAGKILRIVKKFDFGSDGYDSYFSYLDGSDSNYCSFDIYQLHSQNSENRWVKTSYIGNQILFLDWKAGISVTACETTGLKGNCIYYIVSDVYKYNIEDGQTEKISIPFNDIATWLVPSLVPLPAGCP